MELPVGERVSCSPPTKVIMLALPKPLLFAMTTTVLSGQQPTAPPPSDLAALVTNRLGFDLYRALGTASPATNLCFSPYSLAIACAMASEGARDATAAEMARVLHFPAELPLAVLHGAFMGMAQRLREGGGDPSPAIRERLTELRRQLGAANREAERQDGRDYKAARSAFERATQLAAELNKLLPTVQRYDLRTANALWADRSFELVPDYVGTLDLFYGTGGVQAVDFVGDADGARRHINGWVEANTNHRIRDLIPAGGVTGDTRLVISNAVWFLGEWAEPFEASATRDEDFLLADGQRTKVALMRDAWRVGVPYAAFTGTGQYFPTPREVPADAAKQPATYPDDGGFTMVELPYKGDELAMVVLAPRAPNGLPRLERMLTATTLTSWLSQLQPRVVDAALPRFKVSATYELAAPLQALGMRRAFVNPMQTDGAQFGGMSAATDPRLQLYLGSVRQQAWIEVNEKGTEAAAATAIMVASGMAAPDQRMVPFHPVFRADRPFVFLIRDRKSGAILFLGRHVDPRT